MVNLPRKMLIWVVSGSVLLGACGPTPSDAEAGGTARRAEPVGATSTVTESAPRTAVPFSEPARFFDESLPLTDLGDSYESFGDVGELEADSDLVFVGRVAGTVRGVNRWAPAGGGGLVVEYDGVVFTVEEVLAGNTDLVGTELTVEHPAVVTTDSLGPERVESAPIGLLRQGVERAEKGLKSARYLVFVKKDALPDGTEFVLFNTPGGLVELADDGTTLEGAAGPFLFLHTDEGTYTDGLSLDVIRSWIEDGPPPLSIPEDARPKPGTPAGTIADSPSETTAG